MPNAYNAWKEEPEILWISSPSAHLTAAYLFLIGLLLAIFFALPFIYLDTAIVASGMIRPDLEKANIKTGVSGIIREVAAGENTLVKKHSLLFTIDDSELVNQRVTTKASMDYHAGIASDLEFILGKKSLIRSIVKIRSAVYRQQALQFVSQRNEWEIQIRKARRDLMISRQLSKDNIIAPIELDEKQVSYERLLSAFGAFEKKQLGDWELDLADHRDQIRKLASSMASVREHEKIYRIHTPVAGTVQYIGDKYPGTAVEAGETLCMVSPDATLIGECWVNSSYTGILQNNQPAVFRLSGIQSGHSLLTGTISSIDKDYTIRDGQPMFRIRCLISDSSFTGRNGSKLVLMKGMLFTVQFLTQRRSLWQLLYDQAEDWIHPANTNQNT